MRGPDGVQASPSRQDIDALLGLFDQQAFAAAVQQACAMTERFPHYALGWKVLGAVLTQLGQDGAALPAMQMAATLAPHDAEAHTNLGVTLQHLGRFAEAEARHRQALQVNPDHAGAHANLGITLSSLGRFAQAEASYRQALQAEPALASAHNNLAVVLTHLGRLAEAEASCRQALALHPGFAQADNNLGLVLLQQGRLQEAVASHQQALQSRPGYAEAHNSLGAALMALGRLDDAVAQFHLALQSQPGMASAHGNLLFTLNYHPDTSAQQVFAAYQAYDQQVGLPLRATWRPHSNSRAAGRRLKLGYVSPDFRQHSCQHALEPLLAHHDKSRVEVFAYAELAREDAVTGRYKTYVDHWVPTLGMTDETLAERIRADGIDVLVDLAGHTHNARLVVFARKPAPVSLSWLGFGSTTGLSAIDYFLTDAAAAPPGSEALFSEAPWRLDGPALAYRPAPGMGDVGELPALRHGYVTFCTLTRAVRINHRTVRVWSQVLRRVAGSRLVINSRDFGNPGMRDSLADQFRAHGIAPERLAIGFDSPPWDLLRGVDITLDCFPHNSGTTLLESLYMGVPFVTLAGRPGLGRLGSALLHALGQPQWAAASETDYVDKAVQLAGAPDQLAALRRELRQQMQASALMDEAGFAARMEQAYAQMWDVWRRLHPR